MAKPRVRQYPPLYVRDNRAISNTQFTALHDSSCPTAKFYFVVFAAGNQAYPYGIRHADSHREARDLARETHVQLGLPEPEVITVVGACRQERCTCNNALFALRSERPTHRGRWKNSERCLFRTGELRRDMQAIFFPDRVQKHIPLWRAKRTRKG